LNHRALADFTRRLSSRRFHDGNFEPEFGQQKALENKTFSRACLVAGTCNHLKFLYQAVA
jgi:hypothetical protein